MGLHCDVMDFVAAILELSGMWLVGDMRRLGFLFAAGGAAVWITVALTAGVYGLLLVCVPALGIAVRNWRRWGNDSNAS